MKVNFCNKTKFYGVEHVLGSGLCERALCEHPMERDLADEEKPKHFCSSREERSLIPS